MGNGEAEETTGIIANGGVQLVGVLMMVKQYLKMANATVDVHSSATMRTT